MKTAGSEHVPNEPLARVQGYLDLYGADTASVAELLCDRHPVGADAFTVVESDLSAERLTFGDLRRSSECFAAALAALGVGPGDRVATLMGKTIDYVVTSVGIWRLGAVQVPLFTAFAPPAIELRVTASRSRVVVCDQDQRWKLERISMASLLVITSAGNDSRDSPVAGHDLSLRELLAEQEPGFPAAALGGDAPIIHSFTSGTTGRPKGVVVPTRALAAIRAYLDFSLDVRPQDVYWCAADPGWAYGLYYAVVGPLCAGIPSLFLHASFSAELTARVLREFGVTNLTAAPTIYRSLRASGLTRPDGLKLRCASSAGEPLTPEVNLWAPDWLGVEVFDQYGQTEAGMVVSNHHHPGLARPLRSGSMGQDMPGWTSAILAFDSDEPVPPGRTGRIAMDLEASPLAFFGGYDADPDRSAEKLSADGRWFLTGDSGAKDADGYMYFTARDDDVIIMAGYRIGPFEVESVLATHPGVVECAVIGAPDGVRGEVLEAFVALRPGLDGSDALAAELQQLVKDQYAAHAFPRRVHFVAELPKTPSGKIQRFVLRKSRATDTSKDTEARTR